METIVNFLKSLQFIFMPHYWLMLHKYNAQWDREINLALDQKEVIIKSEYEATIGKVSIWIANYPYGYATPYHSIEIRPSRLTILRLNKRIKEKLKKHNDEILGSLIDHLKEN